MRYSILSFILVLFLYYMPMHAAATQSGDCSACHVSHNGGPVKQPLTQLCVTCHRERIEAGEHIVDIVPVKYAIPPGFPLTKDGKLTCITCHDPHSKEQDMLRLQPIALCNSCHKK